MERSAAIKKGVYMLQEKSQDKQVGKTILLNLPFQRNFSYPFDHRSLITTICILQSYYILSALGKCGYKCTRIFKTPTKSGRLGAWRLQCKLAASRQFKSVSRARSNATTQTMMGHSAAYQECVQAAQVAESYKHEARTSFGKFSGSSGKAKGYG